MRKNIKVLGTVAIVGLVAASGSAFTAASTIDSGQKYVGAVSQAISGVTVSAVKYTIGANDTTTAVDFHVTQALGAGDTVKAAVNGGTPVVCTATAAVAPATGTDLACSFGTGVVNVTSLSIVAS